MDQQLEKFPVVFPFCFKCDVTLDAKSGHAKNTLDAKSGHGK